MVRGQRSTRHHVVALTWLMLTMSHLQMSQSYSIDQIICRAMKKSPEDYGYDEKQKTVRVDLDMIFPMEDWTRMVRMNRSGGHTLQKRQAIEETAGGRYWPNGVIYYEISRRTFSRRDIRVLNAAMEEWMRYTCVEFRPAPPYTRNKIVFVDGDGCASNVGMSRGPQAVTLARGCRVKGVVIHELGHVLGFNHEQTRPDRDYYVRIRWENIPSNLKYNFRKYSWDVVRNLGVPYDYLSIMHYGKDTFTGNGRVTIETRDPKFQHLIGNRQGLSFRDIKSANILYNCKPASDGCTLRDKDCPGEGFVSKDCTCWCPTPDIFTHLSRPYYVCDAASINKEGSGSSTNGSSGEGSSGKPVTGKGGQGGSSSECEDQNANCHMWAQRGECQKTKDYMHIYCRPACGLCDTEETPCRDEYRHCAFWQKNGFCGTSSPFRIFITNKCRRTCGVCKAGPGPEGGKTLPCERQCEDKDEQCQEWAQRGECTTTSDYMLRYCRKACNACCTSPAKPK